jgi:hypothetical protein
MLEKRTIFVFPKPKVRSAKSSLPMSITSRYQETLLPSRTVEDFFETGTSGLAGLSERYQQWQGKKWRDGAK